MKEPLAAPCSCSVNCSCSTTYNCIWYHIYHNCMPTRPHLHYLQLNNRLCMLRQPLSCMMIYRQAYKLWLRSLCYYSPCSHLFTTRITLCGQHNRSVYCQAHASASCDITTDRVTIVFTMLHVLPSHRHNPFTRAETLYP